MENATQALIIAGGVLIGIILLSIAAYLGLTMSEYVANTQQQINRNEVNQFNQQFIGYEGLTNLTIQDVITAKNLALEENKKIFGYNPQNDRAGNDNDFIDVEIYDNGQKINILNESLNLPIPDSDKKCTNENLLNKYLGYKFECTEVELHQFSGRVNMIKFKIIPEQI